MKYLVELVTAIAWPAAVIWLGYLFKGEIKKLSSRVSQFKYKDIEANFSKELTEAENEAKKVTSKQTALLELSATASQLDQLQRISEISPRAAIMEAWVIIETAAFEAGLVSGSTRPVVSTQTIISCLAKSGKIPDESLHMISHLRNLRNKAAHLPDFAVNQDDAERYLALATKSAEIIYETKNAS